MSIEVTITMELVDSDQFFCGKQRLAFDYPWAIYIVNGDSAIPYYRVYIGDRVVRFTNTEQEAYNYLKSLTKEQAHIPTREE